MSADTKSIETLTEIVTHEVLNACWQRKISRMIHLKAKPAKWNAWITCA